jgi:GT2 family glycosyltransferase
MSSVDLSIVIVNWHSSEYVRRCVASVLENTRNLSHEIIVVDSGSFDGCGAMLYANFPTVQFVQSERNIGFGRANNRGARGARGAALLFLNPDTELRNNAIEALYARLQTLPNAGVLGCRLVNTDGSLQITCVQPFPTILNQVLNVGELQRRFPGIRWWVSAATFENAREPCPVEVIAGACMMMRRRVYESVGGFDPRFFMYAEDLDICHRIAAAGYVNYYVPGGEIVHHGGGCADLNPGRFSIVMKRASVARLLKKVRGPAYAAAYRLAVCAAACVRLTAIAASVPVALVTRRAKRCLMAAEKWLAILSWSTGFEGWVRQYDLSEVEAFSADTPARHDIAPTPPHLSTRAIPEAPEVSHGRTALRYVVISPARDEASNISATIAAMCAQTHRPLLWVLVNDGSTDDTERLIDEAASTHSWIAAVHRSNRGSRQAGSGVIEAFYDGYRLVSALDWDCIVKLDADLSFEADYFERCLREFRDDPRLGIAGGTCCRIAEDRLVPEFDDEPSFHVRGPTKIYRRQCFESIGGLIKAPGWDTVDQLKANMQGWRTATFPHVRLVHLRESGSAYGSWRNWKKNGLANYVAGYHPVFMACKCVKRMLARPSPSGVREGIGLLCGYALGWFKRVPRVDDPALIRYLRMEQWRALLLRKSLWRRVRTRTGIASGSADEAGPVAEQVVG